MQSCGRRQKFDFHRKGSGDKRQKGESDFIKTASPFSDCGVHKRLAARLIQQRLEKLIKNNFLIGGQQFVVPFVIE